MTQALNSQSGIEMELSQLAGQISVMGGAVESLLEDSLSAMRDRNPALAEIVTARRPKNRALRQNIDIQVEVILALRHPLAADLRRVLGSMKLAYALERSGNLVTNICRRIKDVPEIIDLPPMAGIIRMGEQVQQQLITALNAFINEDVSLAMQVNQSDDDIDELYDTLEAEILALMQARENQIEACACLLFVIRHFERIGDHAADIADVAYYIETAKNIQTSDFADQAHRTTKLNRVDAAE